MERLYDLLALLVFLALGLSQLSVVDPVLRVFRPRSYDVILFYRQGREV